MSYRCVDPFATATGDVYPGGCLVADSDPILQTHLAHFARVDEPVASRTETATAAPGEHRAAKKAPAKKAAPKPEPKPEPKNEPEGEPDA